MGGGYVSAWLAGQEGEGDGCEDGVTTLSGEAGVLGELDAAAASDVTTLPGEDGVVCALQAEGTSCEESSVSTMAAEAGVLYALSRVSPATAARTLSCVLKSTQQRNGTRVLCFLDGASVHQQHYHSYLMQCHQALFRQVEALPPHLKVPLPNPPVTPAPDVSTPARLVHQYNRESLRILKSWLPRDSTREDRAYTIAKHLQHYGIPDVCEEGTERGAVRHHTHAHTHTAYRGIQLQLASPSAINV